MSVPPEDVEEDGGEGWIVSFADLMTLLFAVFVVLYGLKPEGRGDTTLVLGVKSSIREAFQEIPEDIPDEEKDGPVKQGKAVFKYFKGEATKPPIIKKYLRAKNVMNIINKDMEQAKKILEIDPDRKIKMPKSVKAEKPVSVSQDVDGFKIKLVSSYFYEKGKYRVDRKAMPMLVHIGKLLKNLDRPIVIEGHTDNTASKKRNNLELSSLRASSVASYFIQEIGLNATKVAAAGYGDHKPYASNQTEEGRRLNRRIEIKVKYVEGEN